MSEIGEMYAAMRADYKALRARLGVPCPNCTVKLPKAQPKILLPHQRRTGASPAAGWRKINMK